MTSLGKMNWANLLNYNIQPSDLDLFQSYMQAGPNALRGATRGIGLISGGVITGGANLVVSVSAGSAIMPDGTLVVWPNLTATLATANTSQARLDRIEIAYLPTNNTSVQDVNSLPKVLDILNVASINVVQGTPAATPVLPTATSANISLGYVNVTANMTLVGPTSIFQVVDSGLQISPMILSGTGYLRFNSSLGVIQYSNTSGVVWQAVGAGGGGGGSAVWQSVQGSAPIESYELDEKSFKFAQGNNQSIAVFVRVPDSYAAGSPIRLRIGHYGTSGTNSFKFQATASLIRRGVDPLNSTSNQYVSTNGDQAELPAYVYTEVVYDLSSASGQINGLNPSPYDTIKINLTRVTPATTEDSADVAVVPSTTEVLFS